MEVLKKKVLLLSMPDVALSFDRTVKLPNLGLCSIAGNLDGYETYVLDLVTHNKGCSAYLRDILKKVKPDIVGLSAMSFQYHSARIAARVIKNTAPRTKVVLGGYHSTLMNNDILNSPDAPFDYLVRAEGEVTFKLLCDAITNNSGFSDIPGISYKTGNEAFHTRPAGVIDLESVRLPNRAARLSSGYHVLGKKYDCIETSRGCVMGCNFCSIDGMYGKSFRKYPLERVIEDISRLHAEGVKGIFMVDDNITIDVRRFKKLLNMIIETRLNTIDYVIQAGVPGIVGDEELALIMKEAGIKIVFLGIENNHERNLSVYNKKTTADEGRDAVNLLKKNGIIVFGGFIVANPDDTEESIRSTFGYIKKLDLDHAIVQCLTPYPGTRVREELLTAGLIDNVNNFSEYNGFTCNVHTRHCSRKKVNSILFREGFKYYFNPAYRGSSQFLRSYKHMIPKLILNDFSYLYGTLSGRIFPSRHRW